jgi:hypothetical protein
MGVMKAQIDVLESCASALSNERASVATVADELGGAHPVGNSAGTTPASAALIAALTTAAEHWHGELAEGARLLGALGSAIDHDAMSLRNLDADTADELRGSRSSAAV